MDLLSPNPTRISIGSNSPATPPSTPVASPSPKPDSEMTQSVRLFKQLSQVAGEGASTRHRLFLIFDAPKSKITKIHLERNYILYIAFIETTTRVPHWMPFLWKKEMITQKSEMNEERKISQI